MDSADPFGEGDAGRTHTLLVHVRDDQGDKTVGELCNSLSLFGGSPVDKILNGVDGPQVEDLNASLTAAGLTGTRTLVVTFRRPVPGAPGKPEPIADANMQHAMFKVVEAAFDSTPFGLELEGDDGTVFVRQVDLVNPVSALIKPLDVITHVNAVSVRGMKLRDVLKTVCTEKECLTTGQPVVLRFQRLAVHGDADITGNRAVCKPGFVCCSGKFTDAPNATTSLLYTSGPLGVKLKDEARESKDSVGVAVFEVKEECLAKFAGVEPGDKLTSVNGNDTSSMPYSTASRIMTAFLRQMGQAQPLVLGFTRPTGPAPTTVASLMTLGRKPGHAESNSVTASTQASRAHPSKMAAVEPPLPDERSDVALEDVAAAKPEKERRVDRRKDSRRSWVAEEAAPAKPPARTTGLSKTPHPHDLRRYNNTPESDDFMERRATQALQPPRMLAPRGHTRTRSHSAGRVLIHVPPPHVTLAPQSGPFNGYRTKTAALLSTAYADTRRRASQHVVRRDDSIFDRLYAEAQPREISDVAPRRRGTHGIDARLRASSRGPVSRSQVFPTSSRRSDGSSDGMMWEALYEQAIWKPAGVNTRLGRNTLRQQLEQRARSASEKRTQTRSLSRPRTDWGEEDVPSFARPLKRNLPGGLSAGGSDEASMTPHGSTKMWAKGLRDSRGRGPMSSSPPRRSTSRKPAGEADENPGSGQGDSVFKDDDSGQKGEEGAEYGRKDERCRRSSGKDLTATRTSLLRQQLIEDKYRGGEKAKASLPPRGKSPPRSRYGQQAMAQGSRRGKSREREREAESSDDDPEVMRSVTKDVMKELQRERELVAKKAGKSGLRKVGAVTSSGRVSGGSEDFLPPPLPARERRHTHAGKGEGKTRHTSPSLTPASGSNMAQSHEERKTQNSDIHSWAPLDKVLGAGFGGMGHAPPRPPSRSTRGPSPIEESGRWSAELFKAGMIAAASPSALDADESPTPYGQRVPLDMLYEV